VVSREVEAPVHEHTIKARTYIIVCVLLVLLTFLTVGLSRVPFEGRWHIVIGLTIALCKATLVVLFFMHAIISPKLVWIVIAVSGFWLALLMSLTLTDYITRGMVPFMPGH
jgi:cytochrome c oxidase subunit 4